MQLHSQMNASSLPLPSCAPDFQVSSNNAIFQTQVINFGLKTEAISKANFPLDCQWRGEYFLVNYSSLFLVNQQPALWPSGVEDEKEFPEGAHAKT